MRLPKLPKYNKRQVLKFLYYLGTVIVGNAIAAAASSFFIIPNGFVMGGTTGVGIFVEHLLENAGKNADWAVTLTVYVANIALFLLGAFLLGKKFAAATLAGTLLYPSFLSIWNIVNKALNNPFQFREVEGVAAAGGLNQPLLGVIFGSILFGLGIGIVVRVGASTGGTDIPPLIFHKFFNLPVSVGMWGLDISIVLLQFAAKTTVENVLYGILIVLISSIIVDKIAMVGARRAQVKILSKKHEEIRKHIINKLNRGVTLLSGKTGFLKDDCFMLMTIVSFRDVVKLRNSVQKIDPEALFMVSTISEVRGRGFSSDRVALPKDKQFGGEDAENMVEVAPPQENTAEDCKECVAPQQETAAPENKQE